MFRNWYVIMLKEQDVSAILPQIHKIKGYNYVVHILQNQYPVIHIKNNDDQVYQYILF